MPRLRYRKDYDYDFTAEESGNEATPWTGQSWLSNQSVIASFTKAQLLQTINHYKAIISLCETELLSRGNTDNFSKFSTNSSARKGAKLREKRNGQTLPNTGKSARMGTTSIIELNKFIMKNSKLDAVSIAKLTASWLEILQKQKG